LDARLRGHDGKELQSNVIPAKAGIQFLVNPFAICSRRRKGWRQRWARPRGFCRNWKVCL